MVNILEGLTRIEAQRWMNLPVLGRSLKRSSRPTWSHILRVPPHITSNWGSGNHFWRHTTSRSALYHVAFVYSVLAKHDASFSSYFAACYVYYMYIVCMGPANQRVPQKFVSPFHQCHIWLNLQDPVISLYWRIVRKLYVRQKQKTHAKATCIPYGYAKGKNKKKTRKFHLQLCYRGSLPFIIW